MLYSPKTRRSLIAQAHHLNPIVMIGQKGLTESVLTEIDRALSDHQLIKIRISAGSKEERQDIAHSIETELQSTCLRMIGHIAIFHRPGAC